MTDPVSPREALIARLRVRAMHEESHLGGASIVALLREAADALAADEALRAENETAVRERNYYENQWRAAVAAVARVRALFPNDLSEPAAPPDALIELIALAGHALDEMEHDGSSWLDTRNVLALARAALAQRTPDSPAATDEALAELLANVERLRIDLAPLEYGMDGLIDLVKHEIRKYARSQRLSVSDETKDGKR